MATYTTYEAKAKFSELLRRVRGGERVAITYYGAVVAELRPVTPVADEEEALRRLEETGILTPGGAFLAALRPLAARPGALGRFLDERE
jgi:prevent-host-death family protein